MPNDFFTNPPKTIDIAQARSMIRQQFNDQIDQAFTGKSEIERRESMIDKMVQDFTAYADHDNIINQRDFKKFEPLFSVEMRQKYLDRTMSMDEFNYITALSQEFADNYNMQKTTHIVDDNGNEVCPPLPPVFVRLEMLKGRVAEVINTYHTVHANDDGQQGGLNDLYKQKAAYDLLKSLQGSQIRESLISQAADFHDKAVAFHIATDPRAQEYLQQQTTEQVPTDEQGNVLPFTSQPDTVSNDLDVEYGPVDEDD